MNRPNLPLAISSVPASELPFVRFDAAAFALMVDETLVAYDRFEAHTDTSPVVGGDQVSPKRPVYVGRPVSARMHINHARTGIRGTRSGLLASA